MTMSQAAHPHGLISLIFDGSEDAGLCSIAQPWLPPSWPCVAWLPVLILDTPKLWVGLCSAWWGPQHHVLTVLCVAAFDEATCKRCSLCSVQAVDVTCFGCGPHPVMQGPAALKGPRAWAEPSRALSKIDRNAGLPLRTPAAWPPQWEPRL